MLCSNCKNELKENEKFCSNCGNYIKDTKNENKLPRKMNKVERFFIWITGILLLSLVVIFTFAFGIEPYMKNKEIEKNRIEQAEKEEERAKAEEQEKKEREEWERQNPELVAKEKAEKEEAERKAKTTISKEYIGKVYGMDDTIPSDIKNILNHAWAMIKENYPNARWEEYVIIAQDGYGRFRVEIGYVRSSTQSELLTNEIVVWTKDISSSYSGGYYYSTYIPGWGTPIIFNSNGIPTN